MDQCGVGEDGSAALGAGDAEQRGFVERAALAELEDALLLCGVNGEQRSVDVGVIRAGKLLLNEGDHVPGAGLVMAGGRERVALEAQAEAVIEAELVVAGDGALVEVVIGVGVKQAVSKDGGREGHGRAEQRLKTAGGPGVAAGLDDACVGEGGIEAMGPAGELCADGKEAVSEQIDGVRAEVERAWAAKPAKAAMRWASVSAAQCGRRRG